MVEIEKKEKIRTNRRNYYIHWHVAEAFAYVCSQKNVSVSSAIGEFMCEQVTDYFGDEEWLNDMDSYGWLSNETY